MIAKSAWTGPLGWSLAAIVVIVGVVAVQARPLFDAIASPDAQNLDREEKALRLQTKEHATLLATSTKRIAGRYLLDRRPKPWPAPPPPPPPPPPPQDDPPPPLPDEPDPPPAEYTGPKLAGILANMVIFDRKDLRLIVGERDEDNDLEVLEILGGGRARLAHKGGEYVVALFETKDEYFDTSRLDWSPSESFDIPVTPRPPAGRDATRGLDRPTGRTTGRNTGRNTGRSGRDR